MEKYIIIGLIIIMAYKILVSPKKIKEREEQLQKAQQEKRLKEEEQQKAILEYENKINEKLEEIKSFGIKPVESGDLILKKGEICYVNDRARVLYGQYYGFDSIIVTNKRIIISNRDASGNTKNVLALLKDVISASTVESAVFERFLALKYYNGESGRTDSVSVNTSEDSRICEAIIRKLINDMDEEQMKTC